MESLQALLKKAHDLEELVRSDEILTQSEKTIILYRLEKVVEDIKSAIQDAENPPPMIFEKSP